MTKTSARILIVEDDLEWQEIYHRSLQASKYHLSTARTADTALALLKEQPFDVVITDLKMLAGTDDFSGFGVLEQAKKYNPGVQVIVITGYGSADHALRAMGSGAFDYITKDRDLRKKLALTVQGALEVRALKEAVGKGEREDDVIVESDGIIGNSASMQSLFDQIAKVARNEINVLLHGESGTGKRLIAQTIHLQSSRKQGPFLVVDCGRLSETILESQLFGCEAGAFAGVTETWPGKFEQAKGGTIFLDSIGDLEARLQTRLVGAVGDRLVERVGGQEPVLIDARIIASTDKNIDDLLQKKQFHRHLFDTLNEFIISVPPLRQRKDGDDIPALAAMFLRRHAAERQVSFSEEAIEMLRHYDYPGNVRELESAVKYALTITGGDTIQPEHLRPEIRNYQPVGKNHSKQQVEVKDPSTILKVCPLNRGTCSKKDEIIRLYASKQVFVNIPDTPQYSDKERVIRQTLEKYGLVPVLPKDYLEPVILFCNNCKLIQTCKYGITDISTPETNILHTLGQMHAIGMHCSILKESGANQGTDHLQGLFFLEYTGFQSLAEQLSRWIENQIQEAKTVNLDVNQLSQTMPNEKSGLQRELAIYQRTLQKLREQTALYGGQTPPHILIEIEDKEKMVLLLQQKLNTLNNLSS